MKYVALGSLTELSRPITYGVVQPGDDPGDGVPLVRAGDVENGRVAIDVLRTVSQEISRGFSRTVLRGGELLVSLVGNPGEVAVAPPSLAGANLSRQVAMVALGAAADAGYVKYYLMSEVGRAHLFMRTGGAVQQVINLADLKTVPIALPDLAAQRQIASDLESYDDLIDNNRRRIQLLEDSVRLLFDEWFVRLNLPRHLSAAAGSSLPAGWSKLPLEDVLVLQRGFDLPSQDREAGEVPIYGSTGIVGSHNTAKVAGPGLVTGRSGTLGEVHFIRGSFWPLNTALWVKEFRRVTPLFALHLLRGMNLGQYNGGVSVPTLDRKVVHKAEVLLPPVSNMEAFETIASDVRQQIDTLTRMIDKLRTARDLLLPRLMSGELTV